MAPKVLESAGTPAEGGVGLVRVPLLLTEAFVVMGMTDAVAVIMTVAVVSASTVVLVFAMLAVMLMIPVVFAMTTGIC